ncbi:ABC transporter substrate-binding protein [Noviherbaspirillum sedimenti]|uniref:ABC transporter substrate-binding protein n=1 Tax=Noviherbaspirillum sedimenti TaxID=2320865 RepID=A0A3A3G5F6_9BURK|nr:ABC transporter substrate-binding protein [Noviherbaspirillum sedimenti]RJG02915.1 ABC transporter substrate-binding protein [Noviherbaspirillum sedimenti]
MKLKFARFATLAGAIGLAGPLVHAQNISDNVVKIGVISDVSSAYADIGGKGSIAAAQMAIQDFGSKVLGKPVELLWVDHQNKADIGSTKARQWFDQDQADMVIGLGNTAVHNAVTNVAKEKNKIVINTEAGSSTITGENCAANVVHYTYDTYALAKSTGKAVVEHGGKSWFMLQVDYAFGQSLAGDVTAAVNQYGGKVVGSVKHPLNSSDFSSYMMTAQGSKADVIALANGVNDTINSIKTARMFKVTDKQKVAAMMLFISDVHALGLETAQGMFATTAFYWDRTPESRTWSQRYFKVTGKMPTMAQAGTYSAVMHYLKSVQAAGSDDTAAVMAKMKQTPINDFFAKDGKIREDGRMVHDMYLIQVKKPSESKAPWDYYKVIQTIPGDQAFRPLSESACPLVKK